MQRLASFIAAAALLTLTAAVHPARASALDAETCAKLKTEQEELDKGGVRANMAKGTDWAKANLPPEKLEEIRKTIELDEQLLFRCPGRHLVNLPLEPDPPPPAPADDKGRKPEAEKSDSPAASPPAKAATPDKKGPEKKGPAQKKAPQKAANDTSTDPDAKPATRPKSAQKSKSKAGEDAFKPAPSDPNNPLGLF